MSASPLLHAGDPAAPIAWRAGRPVSRAQYLADVHALAARLPSAGPMLNLTADRYRFAVGLGAAMLRGQDNLMPSNHTPDTVARLLSLFPTTYGLTDTAPTDASAPALPMVLHADAPAAPGNHPVPALADDLLTAQVLTSGSTGAPMPHPKHWGGLVRNTEAGVLRLAEHMGRRDLTGVTLVATVPAQHMYGFESTVLLALLSGNCLRATAHPFYPADIAAALEQRTAARACWSPRRCTCKMP